jgi:hypothetical protein
MTTQFGRVDVPRFFSWHRATFHPVVATDRSTKLCIRYQSFMNIMQSLHIKIKCCGRKMNVR